MPTGSSAAQPVSVTRVCISAVLAEKRTSTGLSLPVITSSSLLHEVITVAASIAAAEINFNAFIFIEFIFVFVLFMFYFFIAVSLN
jgi:hypothetical protein